MLSSSPSIFLYGTPIDGREKSVCHIVAQSQPQLIMYCVSFAHHEAGQWLCLCVKSLVTGAGFLGVSTGLSAAKEKRENKSVWELI